MPLLFSYGTLQLENIQKSLFGRLLQGQPDELPGYEQGVVEIGKESYAIVRLSRKTEERVQGMLFEVSEEELLRADRYETKEYKRVEVRLASGMQAWVYLDARPQLRP